MSGKNLLEGLQGPVSQSVDAVKALLTWKGRAVDPFPSVVAFARDGEDGRLMLVLSNNKKSYYVTTARVCSCPAATYHQGPCKHQRKYFAASVQEQPILGSIRPAGSFKPVSMLPGLLEEAGEAAKAIPSMLIDQYDTTDREAAYHSIAEDKAMWPVEA